VRTPSARDDSGVAARLLLPVSCARFIDEHFERAPLHVPRNDASWYDDIITRAQFVEALTTTDPELMRLTSVLDDAKVCPTTVQRALDAFRNGATIVANQLHLAIPAIARLCRGLEVFFCQPFQANAYFTPSGNQGFGAHFDVHEVFILQISGRKAWRVYAPSVVLPFTEMLRGVDITGASPHLDVVLAPGDLLYLPRGWIHEGRAVEGEASLHISLGLISFTWRDLFAMALQDVSLRDARFRETFRMGPTGASHETASAQADVLMRVVLDEMRGRAFESAHERFALARPAVAPRFPGDSPPVTADASMVRNPLVVAVARMRDDGIEVSFQGKCLPFPSEVSDVIGFVLERSEPFRAAELPGSLDLGNRLRLLQHLCDEGLLMHAASQETRQ